MNDFAIVETRGRKRGPTGSAKVKIAVRVDPEVYTYFRALGDKWTSKINEVLLEYVREDS